MQLRWKHPQKCRKISPNKKRQLPCQQHKRQVAMATANLQQIFAKVLSFFLLSACQECWQSVALQVESKGKAHLPTQKSCATAQNSILAQTCTLTLYHKSLLYTIELCKFFAFGKQLLKTACANHATMLNFGKRTPLKTKKEKRKTTSLVFELCFAFSLCRMQQILPNSFCP